jgi:hypothetical protein
MYASGAQHQNNIQLFLSISNQTLDTSENIYIIVKCMVP